MKTVTYTIEFQYKCRHCGKVFVDQKGTLDSTGTTKKGAISRILERLENIAEQARKDLMIYKGGKRTFVVVKERTLMVDKFVFHKCNENLRGVAELTLISWGKL